MRTPNKKTMILAGAFSAGLIAVGGTLAVADGLSGADTTTVAGVSNSTGSSDTTTTRIAPPDQQASTQTAISREQARSIALGLAPGARVLDIELDRGESDDDDLSDRVTKWEVDLVKGNVEYDIDINAQNGEVLKNRSEVDDDSDDRDDSRADRDDDDDDRDDHADDRDDRHDDRGDDRDDDRDDRDDD